MSRLARALILGVVLAVLSLGSTAHAQDAEAPSQPAGVTQPAPTPDPPAQDPPAQDPPAEDPVTPEDPVVPQDPVAPEDPGTTTTTRPPVARPKSLPVTVSPQAGGPGTTVTVRADLRGCLRPNSGPGFFQDAEGRDVDGLSKWLVSQGVSSGRWYTGRYRIAKDDAAGLGQFGVVCDQAILKAILGFANFRVQPSRSPVPVRVTPQAAGRAPRSRSPPRSGGASGSTSGSTTARATG